VLKVLLHLLTLLKRGKDDDDRKLCLLGFGYFYYLVVNLFWFELAIDIKSKLSFRDSSSSCDHNGVFEEGGEFSLSLVASECSCHANDCVFVEDEDCREESSIDELNLVSKEERIDLVDQKNSSRGNLASKDISVGAVVDVGVVSEEVVSDLTGPRRVFLLLYGCEHFIGNHHYHLLVVEEVEIVS
jgi:hypothetical protein